MNRRSFLAGLLGTALCPPVKIVRSSHGIFMALLDKRMKEAEEVTLKAMSDAIYYGTGDLAGILAPSIRHSLEHASLLRPELDTWANPLSNAVLPSEERHRSSSPLLRIDDREHHTSECLSDQSA